ncbi:hypothetical protein [Microlunatus ginsengisoli]|uniref:hypothetical protein n=1 Tax=Microlunatus ginsengisoli TaxID=363863 RepID=UPI0031DFCFF9
MIVDRRHRGPNPFHRTERSTDQDPDRDSDRDQQGRAGCEQEQGNRLDSVPLDLDRDRDLDNVGRVIGGDAGGDDHPVTAATDMIEILLGNAGLPGPRPLR